MVEDGLDLTEIEQMCGRIRVTSQAGLEMYAVEVDERTRGRSCSGARIGPAE